MAIPNNKPIFTIKGNSVGVKMNAANLNIDGTGTEGTDMFKVIEAAAAGAGTVVSAVVFTSAQDVMGVSAARVCRVFMTDAAGANPGIVGEVYLPAVTRSNSLIGSNGTFWFPKPIVLRPGQKILVTQSVRSTVKDDTFAYAIAGDYAQ